MDIVNNAAPELRGGGVQFGQATQVAEAVLHVC